MILQPFSIKKMFPKVTDLDFGDTIWIGETRAPDSSALQLHKFDWPHNI